MLDRGYTRLVAWFGATAIIVLALYQVQLSVLASGLNQLLTQTLGTVFPAYPFLALLVLLTAVRWNEFHRVLLTEEGIASLVRVRFVGIMLVLVPALLWTIFLGQIGGSVYLEMEVAAVSLVLASYGALLAINPKMWRIMLPYASLYAIGLVSPLVMIDALGTPMAALSSYMAAGMTNLLGLHVAWQGGAFAFVSAAGEPISAVVTPVCSAAYSISIYLALIGLAYLDMGSSLARTLKFAVVGVAIIPVLDSARIAIMIWSGFVGGSSAFWGMHDWLGYGIFFAFYVAALAAYSRKSAPGLRTSPPMAVPG